MRILLADDHQIIRRGVRSVLETQPDFNICGEAVDGYDAIEKALELKPDTIIMDISMPRLNGLEATREIRRLIPEIEVLILSQHDSPQVLREALNSGARGYVTKSSINGELIAALEKLRKQELFVDPAVSERDANIVDLQEILRRSAAFEKALVESEERFRSTFELAPVGIAHIAPDGHWLRLNRKACQILGYKQEELVDLTFRNVVHPDDLAADVALKDKLLAGELQQYSMQKRYIHKSGSTLWVNSTVSSVKDSAGKVKYLIAVAEDITERKQAEERIQEAETKLRNTAAQLDLITDKMAVAVARCTREFRYAWVNPHYAEWMRRPVDQIIGREIVDVIGKEAFDQLRPKFEEVLSGAKISYERKTNFAPIGSRWTSAAYTPTFDAAGLVDGWIAVVLDITDIKEAATALQESEARFRMLADVAPVLIWMSGTDALCSFFNKPWLEFRGRNLEEEIGNGWADGVHPDDFKECLQNYLSCFHARKRFQMEYRLRRADGEYRWVLDTAVPRFTAPGEFAGYIGSCIDITERKEWEDALKNSESKLQRLAGSLELRVAERTRELASKNAELERQTEVVHRLTARLLQVGDEERRRIARNLHDSAGQTLVAVALNLAVINVRSKESAPDVASVAEESRELVQQLSEEIRTLSYLLHPPLLEESGLVNAICWLADGITKRSQIAVKLEIGTEIDRLSQEIELAIFRIVQECLSNVYRHSGSKSATIRLNRDSNGVMLQVEDQGHGMSPSQLHRIQNSDSGVGIRGIQERIRPFSGTLDIQSDRHGTKIAVKIPLLTATAHAG